MTAQAALWGAGAAAALALLAVAADWARQRRRNLDSVGWVPWPLVQVLALFAALALVLVGFRG